MLAWLDEHPAECNDVMEGVVRVLSLTGARESSKADKLDPRTILGEMCD